MIPRQCKRLAEVDFPIAAVSRHAVREKSIRHGHPSTLHLWWARRPLASSRAVLLALLLPDPCDPHCPGAFKEAASKLLPTVGGGHTKSDNDLRRRLLKFIADFANWDNAANSTFLNVGRSLVTAAHGEEAPLVVDPFAGGGSIPLEALRLGCEAFASDLNPVACLILKVMLEDIPRHGPELADELREAGAEIKRRAERELADLYPADPDGATPIAYLWARTVRCEAPDCGAEIPLMRSFWLCKKAKRKRALRHSVERVDGAPPKVLFEVFEPKTEREVRAGTVTRAKATCLCCGAVLPPERVRLQLAAERGGADAKFDADGTRIGGARMTAVVTLRPNKKGRHYRLPSDADYAAVRQAQTRVSSLLEEWERGGKQGLCPVPDEPLPPIGTLGFRVQRYGMLQWGDLFTARQKLALITLGNLTQSQIDKEWLKTLVAFGISKQSDFNSSLSRWANHMEKSVATFGRQALPILWDWAEVAPLEQASGGFEVALTWIGNAARNISIISDQAQQVQVVNATKHVLPDQSSSVWFTDPPYYDAVPYADLSDFFFIWLKRTLPSNPVLQDPFDSGNPLSPKTAEAVQDGTKQANGRQKNREWFEETMAQAFSEGRRVCAEDGIGSVVFAHKTTEGWEALLSGLIRGGWTITNSWPLATEKPDRMRAMDSAALATSIHLVCRRRPNSAPIGEWADVLRELPLRVADWMEHLQQEGVRGADLVFACIGPALEIFSRYRAVETAEGKQVGLPDYLEKVWEVVGRAALEQVLGMAEASARNGMAGALEEDARLTALFLWALQSTEEQGRDRQTYEAQPNDGGHSMIRDAPASTEPGDAQEEAVAKATAKGFHLPFDVVRRFSQPMGIDLDHWQGRVIAQEKGVVRLLPVAERAEALFGADGAGSAALWIEIGADASGQESLFPELGAGPQASAGKRVGGQVSADAVLESPDATALDRVHAAMLLQSGGHANALRTLILSEQERAPDFLRLSNALSALYPRGSREKRLLDAMLLAVPR
ncbi:MAG: DUF1156 domain-containing protein [Gammaproteobacteria bacterium]|nr:DUF1156 domain-containing protein [Gammaproteobacteria bacterium]